MFGFSTGLENAMHISLEEVVLIGKSRLCKQTLSVKGCSIPLTKVNLSSIGNIPLKKLTSLQNSTIYIYLFQWGSTCWLFYLYICSSKFKKLAHTHLIKYNMWRDFLKEKSRPLFRQIQCCFEWNHIPWKAALFWYWLTRALVFDLKDEGSLRKKCVPFQKVAFI